MNQIEAIQNAGRKAALARQQHDESLADSFYQWARKAIRLEDDRLAAEKAYNKGYASVR